MKKVIIIFSVITIFIAILFIKENVNIEDDVYVVSHSEKEEKKSINNNIPKIVEENIDKENTIVKKEITIYISGEVNNPGIVTINNDKRLYDAVEELGGVTNEADLSRINLAIKLEDEKHYIIPKIGDEIDEKVTVNAIIDDNSEGDKININNASLEDLDSLPGVGEATANKIIKYREENDNFNVIDEIKNVNGIGDKKYEELKDLICIE